MDWSLEETTPDSRSTLIHDEACWVSEGLSGIEDSTGAIAAIAVSEREVFGFALDLRGGIDEVGWSDVV